ncbi:hypothetical protein ACLOJK_018266, partial [Asimina triloba]
MKYSSISISIAVVLLLLSFHSGEVGGQTIKCNDRMKTRDDCLQSRCMLACADAHQNGEGECDPVEQS